MSDFEICKRYLYTTLTDLLEIPVYSDLQEGISDRTYCVFYVLDGTPQKYVSNITAWTEFDVRVNIWSDEFKYIGLNDITEALDGVQGVTVTSGTDTGYIQSIQFIRQNTIHNADTPEWFGVQAEFKFRIKRS